MKTISTALILLGLLAGCKAPATDNAPEQTPDTIRETKALTGTFVGFEAGDYLHAVIRQPDDQTRSFFLDRGMEIFLVDHKDQPLELTYQVVDINIPEAGGVTTIERLSAIRAGDQTFADWWKTAEPSFARLLDEYQPRIEEATLDPANP